MLTAGNDAQPIQLVFEFAAQVEISPRPPRFVRKRVIGPVVIQLEFEWTNRGLRIRPKDLTTPELVAFIQETQDDEAVQELLQRYHTLFFKQAQDAESIGATKESLVQDLQSHLILRLDRYKPTKGVTFGLWAKRVVWNQKIQIVRKYDRQFDTRTNAESIEAAEGVAHRSDTVETLSVSMFLESLEWNERGLVDDLVHRVKKTPPIFNRVQAAVFACVKEKAVEHLGGGILRFLDYDG